MVPIDSVTIRSWLTKSSTPLKIPVPGSRLTWKSFSIVYSRGRMPSLRLLIGVLYGASANRLVPPRVRVLPLGVVRMPAYLYPYQVSSTSRRGARSWRQNFHDIALDG